MALSAKLKGALHFLTKLLSEAVCYNNRLNVPHNLIVPFYLLCPWGSQESSSQSLVPASSSFPLPGEVF